MLAAGGLALAVGLGAAGHVHAQALTTTISAVTVDGTETYPSVTVTGSGFGSSAPANSQAACGGYTGTDFPGPTISPVTTFLFNATQPGGFMWSGGYYDTNGHCDYIGVIIDSWSDTQVKFHFGSAFPAYGSLPVGTTVQVTINGVTSAPTTVTRITLGSTVHGTFYTNTTDSGYFLGTSGGNTELFTQDFPVINFNPPYQGYCSNNTGVSSSDATFTDVYPNGDGTCGTLVAAGNGYTAGENPTGPGNTTNLTSFQAVFETSIDVPAPGTYTILVGHDDGFVLGIGKDQAGDQAQGAASNPDSGSPSSPPATTYAEHLPVISAVDGLSGNANGETVTISFASAGTYPLEVDYTEANGHPTYINLDQGFDANPSHPYTPLTATPELGSGELLATGVLPILALALYRRRRARRATPQDDTIASPDRSR